MVKRHSVFGFGHKLFAVGFEHFKYVTDHKIILRCDLGFLLAFFYQSVMLIFFYPLFTVGVTKFPGFFVLIFNDK